MRVWSIIWIVVATLAFCDATRDKPPYYNSAPPAVLFPGHGDIEQ